LSEQGRVLSRLTPASGACMILANALLPNARCDHPVPVAPANPIVRGTAYESFSPRQRSPQDASDGRIGIPVTHAQLPREMS